MARTKHEINIYPDLNAASRALAENLMTIIRFAIAKRGRFTLALAGGNTPRLLYTLLATTYSNHIRWTSIHIFWGDERYVPQSHPESNFTMAFDTLISKVPVPPENVHPIPTKIEPPEKAASSYEQHLREFFHSSDEDDTSPTFDVILLGVGSDGHTASIFPGSPILREKERWVSTVIAPSYTLIPERITLTFPIINRANYAFFLVSGVKKKKIVRSILDNLNTAIKLYPAAMVHPRIKSVWFVDLEAANTVKK